ncbi:MAG: hypothetical protein WCG29_12030 [Desulfomonile sp.]|nr:hypothetical protein [Deltaproteobacteria bacterium]
MRSRTRELLEADGEFGLTALTGLEVSGFLTWELFRGTCPMNLERRAAGQPVSVTSAMVDFSYDRSSLTIGGKVTVPLALPF